MFEFSVARLPRIEFGAGAINRVPDVIASYGAKVLLVTGAHSYQNLPGWQSFIQTLNSRAIRYSQCKVAGEPSPALVDDAVREFAGSGFDVVAGIGGGSALDAAKAIAGLLKLQRPIMDYLEGVGSELPYEGPAVPLIAVPTTAGTGSEATKNAVLSVQGEHGFKKSFRHEKLVAEYAIVDPELLRNCPPEVVAANGMDALTQLLESYVSTKAGAFTDALAISGLQAVRDALIPLYQSSVDANAQTSERTGIYREKMAYAALLSGITLAQVGLGSVHGVASPLGAFYPIPHGVVCGTLVAAATETNIKSMQSREPDNKALAKYAYAAEILCQQQFHDEKVAHMALTQLLTEWTQNLSLPCLSDYGIDAAVLDKIVANSRGSSMKTNPIVLQDAEIRQLLLSRL
ncbi:alcohol dehydrogenase [Nitrosomonas sp. Nm51]|uniref:iron-containing alcohol dehydrogenase n=1 Tax=Nitrosomonas sp. Nm51 TaxID=133720 RepID=UPI0008C4ED7C|nr:iron-containing alcohol dehydrogenase [Nitrosomonas sp. Nm51]SER53297.1 alcohol dehydrogenase [Nitrosomonas sp. Nm51]